MPRFYYANGQRQELNEDGSRVVVAPARVVNAPALRDRVEALCTQGTALRGGYTLLPREALQAETLEALQKHPGALLAVYEHEGVTVVPLPEVRVELEAGDRAPTLEALDAMRFEGDIDDEGERLVLRPRSGSGDEALNLANYLHETAHPAAAMARTLQVMPRPRPAKSRNG